MMQRLITYLLSFPIVQKAIAREVRLAVDEVEFDDMADNAVEKAVEQVNLSKEAENAVEEAMRNTDFDRTVERAVEDVDIERCVEDAIKDADIEEQMEKIICSEDTKTLIRSMLVGMELVLADGTVLRLRDPEKALLMVGGLEEDHY
jgi:hypothetical protein